MTARANLRPDFGARVSFVQVELPRLPFSDWADLVFSTATFHWVPRSRRALPRASSRALRPAAACSRSAAADPNLAAAHRAGRTRDARESRSRRTSPTGRASGSSPTPRRPRPGWPRPASSTSRRASKPAPTTLADEASYREFVTTVIYNPHLARLPEGPLRAAVHRRGHGAAPRERIRRSRSTTGASIWKADGHDASFRRFVRPITRCTRPQDGQEHDLRIAAAARRPQRVRARPGARAARACRHGQGLLGRRRQGVFLLEGRELPMRAGDLLVAPEGVPHGVRNTGPAGCSCWRFCAGPR